MATILLVEDNDDVREMMAVVLELGGRHTVQTAVHGLEALALLHEGLRPALILVDLMMPFMNGWELLAALKEAPEFSEIPLVIVSAVMSESVDIEEAGSTRSLSKPVDIDEMLHLVNEICAEPRELSGLDSHP